MGKLSQKDFDVLLMNDAIPESERFTSVLVDTPGFKEEQEVLRYKTAQEKLSKVLGADFFETGQAPSLQRPPEDVLAVDDTLDPLNNIVIKDTGEPIDQYYNRQYKTQQMAMKAAEFIDPDTGEFDYSRIGKSAIEKIYDNTITSSISQLTNVALGGDIGASKYGISQADISGLTFDERNAYYDGIKLNADFDVQSVLREFLAESIEYDSSGFTDSFLTTAATFAIDLPVFMAGGKVAGSIMKGVLPGSHLVTGATKLPLDVARNIITMEAASLGKTVEHGLEGGTDAILDDIFHNAQFGVLAGTFGFAGEAMGTGVSKFLSSPNALSTRVISEALRRNPAMVKMMSGTGTSGALGYLTTDGTTEEKLATGLTFASMHFTSPNAWKSYARGEQKAVMVGNDHFEAVKAKMRPDPKTGKPGLNYTEALKEAGVLTEPKYFVNENNQLQEIDGRKFTTQGVVEKNGKAPIDYTKETAKGYKYIVETIPFAKKTFKEGLESGKTAELAGKVKKQIDKTPNPYDKESMAWELEESRREISAYQMASMKEAKTITDYFKSWNLPAGLKPQISELVNTYKVTTGVVESYLQENLASYFKNPEAYKAQQGSDFIKDLHSTLEMVSKEIMNTTTKRQLLERNEVPIKEQIKKIPEPDKTKLLDQAKEIKQLPEDTPETAQAGKDKLYKDYLIEQKTPEYVEELNKAETPQDIQRLSDKIANEGLTTLEEVIKVASEPVKLEQKAKVEEQKTIEKVKEVNKPKEPKAEGTKTEGGEVPVDIQVRDESQKLLEKQYGTEGAEYIAPRLTEKEASYLATGGREGEALTPERTVELESGLGEVYKKQATEAEQRIKESYKNIAEGQKLGAGIDPTLLKDYARVGVYEARKLIDKGMEAGQRFGEWSKEMFIKFGEKVKPYLTKTWDSIKSYAMGDKAILDQNTLGMFGGEKAKEQKKEETPKLKVELDSKLPPQVEGEILRDPKLEKDIVEGVKKTKPSEAILPKQDVHANATKKLIDPITKTDVTAVKRTKDGNTFGKHREQKPSTPLPTDKVRSEFSAVEGISERNDIQQTKAGNRYKEPNKQPENVFQFSKNMWNKISEGATYRKTFKAVFEHLSETIPPPYAREKYENFNKKIYQYGNDYIRSSPLVFNTIMRDIAGWKDGKNYRGLMGYKPSDSLFPTGRKASLEGQQFLDAINKYERAREAGTIEKDVGWQEFADMNNFNESQRKVLTEYKKSMRGFIKDFKTNMHKIIMEFDKAIDMDVTPKQMEKIFGLGNFLPDHLNYKKVLKDPESTPEQIARAENMDKLVKGTGGEPIRDMDSQAIRAKLADHIIDKAYGNWGESFYYNGVRPASPDIYLVNANKVDPEGGKKRYSSYFKNATDANAEASRLKQEGYTEIENYRIGDVIDNGKVTGKHRLTPGQIYELANQGHIKMDNEVIQTLVNSLKSSAQQHGIHKEYAEGMKYTPEEFEFQLNQFGREMVYGGQKIYAFKKMFDNLATWEADVTQATKEGKDTRREQAEIDYSKKWINQLRLGEKSFIDGYRGAMMGMHVGGIKPSFLFQQGMQGFQTTLHRGIQLLKQEGLGTTGDGFNMFGDATAKSVSAAMALRARRNGLPIDKINFDPELLKHYEALDNMKKLGSVGMDEIFGLGGETDWFYSNKVNKSITGLIRMMSWAGKGMEKLTRMQSAAMAYSVGQRKGLKGKEMTNFMADFIDQTMAHWGTGGRSPFLDPKSMDAQRNAITHAMKKSFMTYKTFAFTNYGLWESMIRNKQWAPLAIKSMFGLGMHGVTKFPLLAGMLGVAQMFTDEDVDWTLMDLANDLDEEMPGGIGTLLNKGVGGYFGVDLTNTFNESTPLLPDLYANTWSKTWDAKLSELALGAPYTSIKDFAEGTVQIMSEFKHIVMNDPNYTEAQRKTNWKKARKVLPVFARNALENFSLKEDGVEYRGKRIVTSDQIDSWDVIMKVMSFQPTVFTNAYVEASGGLEKQIEEHSKIISEATKYLKEYPRGTLSDEERDRVINDRKEAKEKIRELKQKLKHK